MPLPDLHPIVRTLKPRGLDYLAHDMPFFWNHLDNAASPLANRHAWIYGGVDQLAPTTLTNDNDGTWVYDPRVNLLVNAPQNRLGFGAGQFPARTNLITRSYQYNSYYVQTRSSLTDNQLAAPDGTTTAAFLKEDGTASTTHKSRFNFASDPGSNTYCLSVFVKAGTRTRLGLGMSNSTEANNAYYPFNLSAGTVGSAVTSGTGWSGVNAGIRPIPGLPGWYRIWVVVSTASDSQFNCWFYMLDNSENLVYSGDNTSGLYVFGTQLELGATFPGPYMPTAGSTNVRDADALRWTNSGLFSPLASEGTLFVAFRSPYAGTVPSADTYIAGLNGSNSKDNFAGFFVDESEDDLRAEIRSGGSGYASIDLGSMSRDTDCRLAMAWKVNDVRAAGDGTLGAADTSATMPLGATALEVGGGESGDTRNGMEFQTIMAFNRALTNDELVALTLGDYRIAG